MTSGIIALIASYIMLCMLLLSLNLRSFWRWQVKGGAILITGLFFAVAYLGIEALLGWPTESAPPASFHLHAAHIQEPDRRKGERGAIYLWLSPMVPPAAQALPPRAYALPYSRDLHEAVARAQAQLRDGRKVSGEAKRGVREGQSDERSPRIDLYEAPVAALPAKPAS